MKFLVQSAALLDAFRIRVRAWRYGIALWCFHVCHLDSVMICCSVGQVASPWDRAVARARFGPPRPAGGDTVMEAEARFVVERSRGVADDAMPHVVGSGRRCAQGARAPRGARPGVHGGDDTDGDDDTSRPADESDEMHGRAIGGVIGLLGMAESVTGTEHAWAGMEESVLCPGEQVPYPGPYVPKINRERAMRRGERVLYHGKHGPITQDNVHGCVRHLVVPLGELGAGD